MVRNKAFTLIEMLVVLFIIGFLAAFILPRLYRNIARSDVQTTKLKMSKISEALLQYKQDMGRYPIKRDGGIQALFFKPNVAGAEKWDGPYLDSEEDLEDKWGEPFELNTPPVKYKQFRYFEVVSPGGGTDEAKEIYIGA
jgi:general secretion pathway protein G